jgi:crossover junction endodeoxyribonuclease RuvC
MKSLGVDLSTKATGVVLLHSSADGSPGLLGEWLLTSELDGLDKYRDIVLQLMTMVHGHKPERIVIEGYSLNLKNASSVVPLVELGALFRFMLMLDNLTWLDPRAGEVKLFALGKGNGNAKKNKMLLGVYKRWGFEAKCDDTADAYVCAAIGLAHGGKLKGLTKDMLGVVGQLKIRRW